jgi:hypothetical protein
MPSQSLLEQFFQALEASKSFKLLSVEQQMQIRNNFLNASDKQLLQALAALKEDAIATQSLEAEQRKNDEKKQFLLNKIKITVKEVRKDQLKENEEQDAKNSSDVLQVLEENLEKSNSKPKTKKFLGIF